MEISPEKIHKPKLYPSGKTKSGGTRIRIEWEEREAISLFSGERLPKSQASLRGSKGRRTGHAKSLNPFCGKTYPFTMPAKKIGRAFLDSNGDFILKGAIPKEKYSGGFYCILEWEGEDLPKNIQKF